MSNSEVLRNPATVSHQIQVVLIRQLVLILCVEHLEVALVLLDELSYALKAKLLEVLRVSGLRWDQVLAWFVVG